MCGSAWVISTLSIYIIEKTVQQSVLKKNALERDNNQDIITICSKDISFWKNIFKIEIRCDVDVKKSLNRTNKTLARISSGYNLVNRIKYPSSDYAWVSLSQG